MKLDYILHFLVGLAISALVVLLFNPLLTILFVSLVAFFKEAYDLIVKGTKFDFWDFAYTILGGIIGSITYFL